MQVLSFLVPGMTFLGALLALAVLGRFAWGIAVELKGAPAGAPPFRAGGHAPGAEGTPEPRGAAPGDRAP